MLKYALLISIALTFAASAQDAVPVATLATTKMTEVQDRIAISGSLVAREKVVVHPLVSGFEITDILVDIGDRVSQGQVLARLADQTLKAQAAQALAEERRAQALVGQAENQIVLAKANLNQTETAYERAQQLRRGGTTSQANLDQAINAVEAARAQAASAEDGLAVARAALAQAQAARDIAQINLTRAVITAPVAGLIVDRTAQQGAIANAGGAPLFTLIAKGQIEVEAEIVETALGQIAIGDEVLLNVASVGMIPGTLRRLPASVDPISRLGLVRIGVADDPRLKTGLYASGWIIADKRRALTVPASAVLNQGGMDVVQLVVDGVVETRPVQAGLLWQDRREIQKGLEQNDHIIARAGAFFRDGARVQPAKGTAPE